jgi:hypothetical protein
MCYTGGRHGEGFIGTPPATRRAARVAALVVLTGLALFAGAAIVSPTAQARSQTVCCFRITVEVSGEAQGLYTKVDPTDSQGLYDYKWDGQAYGLAHLQGSALQTDRGVAAGYLAEFNNVKDGEGRPRDRETPGCSSNTLTGRLELRKTRHGSPTVGLDPVGGLAFDRPFEHWELHCGSLATETGSMLDDANAAWAAPRQFFFRGHINGLSARKLAKGRSQEVTCVEQSRPPAEPRMFSLGFLAVSIKIVPFPADDLKRQQHRLAGFVGDRRDADYYKHRPVFKLQDDFFANKHVPRNGCRKG